MLCHSRPRMALTAVLLSAIVPAPAVALPPVPVPAVPSPTGNLDTVERSTRGVRVTGSVWYADATRAGVMIKVSVGGQVLGTGTALNVAGQDARSHRFDVTLPAIQGQGVCVSAYARYA